MADDPKAGPTRRSTPEFLAVLERSGILPDAKCREVLDQFAHRANSLDSLVLAHHLIGEGTITEFQARRLLTGTKRLSFGRYILLDRVGQGSRGRVFKARHRLMDRVVALKVLLPDRALTETWVSRFVREMKIVGLLDHANVVRAIDADVHEGCPYIVMEYLEGDDLEHVFARRGPLPPEKVIMYMVQAARGLAHAHERGVIHRDVKPTNLFLTKTGTVKLLDLGFGELVGMTGLAANVFDTDENIVVGTTDFMSPELVSNKPIDYRTDLFSLGCTMYRLLTGAYAFPGETREDRLVKRIRERHTPITEVRSGLSRRLVEVVDRLLASRPENRFGSAAEVAEALESLMPRADRPASAKPVTKPADDDVASEPAEPEPPLDWELIESALRPAGPALETPRLLSDDESKSPSRRRLSAHRKNLEEEGIESGREVHQQYRNELKQMKTAMLEQRSAEPTAEVPTRSDALRDAFVERMADHVSEFLVEPSPTQLFIIAVVILSAVVLAVGIAL